MSPRITELWAWVIADSDEEDEGVPAFLDPRTGVWAPLMGADRDRALSLRPEAQRVANLMGKPVMLRRALALEQVEVVQPEGS